jgi:hypothetical protein
MFYHFLHRPFTVEKHFTFLFCNERTHCLFVGQAIQKPQSQSQKKKSSASKEMKRRSTEGDKKTGNKLIPVTFNVSEYYIPTLSVGRQTFFISRTRTNRLV